MKSLDENDDRPWIRLIQKDQLRVGQMKLARMGVRQVVVVHTRDGFRAFKNTCPHAGAPLSGGTLSPSEIVCPRHGWKFRLDDGRCEEHPLYQLKMYETRIEDGWVVAQEDEEIW